MKGERLATLSLSGFVPLLRALLGVFSVRGGRRESYCERDGEHSPREIPRRGAESLLPLQPHTRRPRSSSTPQSTRYFSRIVASPCPMEYRRSNSSRPGAGSVPCMPPASNLAVTIGLTPKRTKLRESRLPSLFLRRDSGSWQRQFDAT